jgi:hypothetical protein
MTTQKKYPWFRFYPAAWLGDPKLRLCDAATRGIFIDLLCIMDEAEPRGHLLINGKEPSKAELSRLLGVPHQAITAAITRLVTTGSVSVSAEGVIYSRRMVRDTAKQLEAKQNGARGGNPTLRHGVNPRVKGRVNPIEDRVQRIEDRAAANATPLPASNDEVGRNATSLVAIFDSERARVYGPEFARPFPDATDSVHARRWLEAGADADLCRRVMGSICERQRAAGKSPPQTLKYFDGAIRDALAQAATTPNSSSNVVALHGGDETQWWVRVSNFVNGHRWIESLWGPDPLSAGCFCPASVLDQFREQLDARQPGTCA